MKLVKIAFTVALALNINAAFAKAVMGETANCAASKQGTRDESQALRAQRVTRSVMASTQQRNQNQNDSKGHRESKKGG